MAVKRHLSLRSDPSCVACESRTILIDCGKTFREQALKFFPKNGLRKIDACVLTRELSAT